MSVRQCLTSIFRGWIFSSPSSAAARIHPATSATHSRDARRREQLLQLKLDLLSEETAAFELALRSLIEPDRELLLALLPLCSVPQLQLLHHVANLRERHGDVDGWLLLDVVQHFLDLSRRRHRSGLSGSHSREFSPDLSPR